MIGTDAWVQVVRDDARAQGGYRACKAWGPRRVERGERQREGKQSGRASEASSGVDGRVGSSVGERSLRGVQPSSGLARRGGRCHTAAHLQYLSCHQQFLSRQARVSSASPESSVKDGLTRELKKRPALVDETLSFLAKVTGKDEASMRPKFEGMKLEDLRRERDRWRNARKRNNGSEGRRKKRGSCSRGNRDWERREERSSSGSTNRR